jgi:spore maturation protein CgeB
VKLVLFVHSLRSDWNHGNAHFVRGVASELVHRGHEVVAFEPEAGWSAENLARDHGPGALESWRESYPELARCVRTWRPGTLDLAEALDGADVVLVHEWSDPDLVARLGEERARRPALRLLFHDTHHRAATRAEDMARFDLTRYDGVLAFGRVVRDLYLARGWARRAFVWHEAADVRRFRPLEAEKEGDLVFVGNWGDEERTEELREFLLGPVRDLGLAATVHGVRYPESGRAELAAAGIAFRGYLPNPLAPSALARHRVTVHVPRRPYARALPGIPTIRPFEAMACGIPLVCAPWDDVEGLFRPGRDYLVARDGGEMRRHLRAILDEPAIARSLVESGLETIRARHTCSHRVDELMGVLSALG